MTGIGMVFDGKPVFATRDFGVNIPSDGQEIGRVLLDGSPGESLFFPPIIIADPDNDAALVTEEQFGPARPIIKYSNLEDAHCGVKSSGLGVEFGKEALAEYTNTQVVYS